MSFEHVAGATGAADVLAHPVSTAATPTGPGERQSPVVEAHEEPPPMATTVAEEGESGRRWSRAALEAELARSRQEQARLLASL